MMASSWPTCVGFSASMTWRRTFATCPGAAATTTAQPASAQIAEALPASRVLKAFNTTFAGTLAAGTVGSLTTTVLIAGDDADAKSSLAGVITSGGLNAIDAGSLQRAGELESLGFLQLSLAVNEKIAWTGGFGVVA